MSETLRSTLMENAWFPRKPLVFHRTIPDTKDLTSYSSSSMSETLRSTLMGTSWYLSKSMLFYLCGQTSKQASRQFMFARLFSTRKRTTVFFSVSKLFAQIERKVYLQFIVGINERFLCFDC